MRDGSYESFALDLDAFGDDVEEAVVTLCRWIALRLWQMFTDVSPVLTGRFRAAWTVAVGDPDETVPAERSEDLPPLPRPSTPSLSSEDVRLDVPIYLNNQLPYGERIEDGWSENKAPQGVVAVSLDALVLELRDQL